MYAQERSNKRSKERYIKECTSGYNVVAEMRLVYTGYDYEIPDFVLEKLKAIRDIINDTFSNGQYSDHYCGAPPREWHVQIEIIERYPVDMVNVIAYGGYAWHTVISYLSFMERKAVHVVNLCDALAFLDAVFADFSD